MNESMTMNIIHSMQSKVWNIAFKQWYKPKPTLKEFMDKAEKAETDLLNYLKVDKEFSEEYELSAQVSDSILQIARLKHENMEKVQNLIQKLYEQQTKNPNL